jgi:hypothetical protein
MELSRAETIEKLREDEHYYGTFGSQFLSNSNIKTLMENPLQLGAPQPPTPNFAIGGYFHTAILEPSKLGNFRIVEASTRSTKKYKEEAAGEMCLLTHEVVNLDIMIETMLDNNVCRDLIKGKNVEYEVPAITEIEGNMWKGKADIVNHDEKLIIDLKTTGDLDGFRWSAKKFNYDSQAYVYKRLFGYDMMFIAIDKKTHQIGIYDCSEEFYERGYQKLVKATEVYDLFYKTDNFDPKQFFINQTL